MIYYNDVVHRKMTKEIIELLHVSANDNTLSNQDLRDIMISAGYMLKGLGVAR